jgi:cyclic dehypoxanthinyl futalosine synthase
MRELSSFEHVLEERIDQATALELLEKADLPTLGYLADQVRRRFHPDDVVTFVIDRNVNYTNVCVAGCKFCAFQRKPSSPEGYVLDTEGDLKESARAGRLGWDYSTYARRTKSRPPP